MSLCELVQERMLAYHIDVYIVNKNSLTYNILDINRRSFFQKELQGRDMAFLRGYK
jgi:hypothetical protein